MSQPSETPSSPSGPTPDARWVSAVVWLGLLAALLVTSAYAIHAMTYGLIASSTIKLLGSQHSGVDRTTVASLILSIVAAFAVLGAWLRFVRATPSLIPGQAGGGGATRKGSRLAAWLVPGRQPPGETEEKSGDEPQSPATGVRDVLITLAAAWFVLIITTAILALVRSTA